MAYFGTNMEKVSKIDAPLLVVGLGGTGADGVLRIKNEFAQRLVADRMGNQELDRPPRTAYLVLDTDPFVLQKRYHGTSINRDTEWLDLSNDIRHLLGNNGANLDPCIRKWLDKRFYTDENLIRDAATNGAGTYRQLSRLMLFRKAQDVISKLQAVLTRLNTIPAGAPVGAKAINVVVVSGLSGGTGSGAFLDFAYLLRHAASILNIEIKVELYAIAPDVTINRHATGDAAKMNIYKTNSFGALKELDYWMSCDKRKEGALPAETLVVDYGSDLQIPWATAPYDDVTLLCATNTDGALLENAYHVVISSMAETLLFMMAEEANRGDVVNQDQQDYSSANDSYSFQSAKSNEYAYRQSIQRPYPQSYCYRAIGAYSNLGEQRNKVSIEADLLFHDIQAFCMAPTSLPQMNGGAPDHFFEPILDLLGLQLDSFCTATMYDSAMFSGTTPWTMSAIKAMDASLAPHGDIHAQWVKDVQDKKEVLREQFKQELRDRFIHTAKDYIMTNGPEALHIMLRTPETGFIAKLLDKANSYDAQGNNYRAEYNIAINGADAAFRELQSLDFIQSLLRSGQVFDQYRSMAESLYINKQNETFCKLLADLLKELAMDVRTQILDRNLKYTLDALSSIQKEVEEDVKNIPVSAGAMHLVDMNEMKQQIRNRYNEENNKATLINTVLSSAADAAIRFSDSNDSETADLLIRRIDNMISTIFHEINDMTLQSQLVGFGDINADGVATFVQETIAPQLERGAKAHFALSSSYGGLNTTNSVLSSYISIPDGASQVHNGIRQYISQGSYSGAVIKSSAINDRIFWMNVVAGLPLCAYSFLGEYEKVYEAQKSMRPGTHLVTMNDEDLQHLQIKRSVLNDWNLLPSPNPFKLLGAQPIPENILHHWNQNETLIKRAEGANVLVLNTNFPTTEGFKACIYLLRDAGGAPLTAQALQAMIEDAVVANSEKQDQIAALRRLLDTRSSFDLIHDVRFAEQVKTFSKALGVAGVFDSDENVRKQCFRELAYYRLSQRPTLLLEIEKQLDLIKFITDRIAQIESDLDGESAIDQAIRTVARLQLYRCIKMKLTSVLYYNSLGELETSGTPNKLFDHQMASYSQEPWANYIPLEARLTEWYAQQDHKDEPFTSIEEMMRVHYEHSMDPDDTDEDVAMCVKYRDEADAIIATLDRKIVNLKSKQKEMPRMNYDLALKIMNGLKAELKGISSTWSGL